MLSAEGAENVVINLASNPFQTRKVPSRQPAITFLPSGVQEAEVMYLTTTEGPDLASVFA